MPTLTRHRDLDILDWRELQHPIRLARTDGRCERCGRPHGRKILCFGEGLWWDEDALAWRCGAGLHHGSLPPPHGTALPMRRTRVFLSTCHLDHDPTNNDAANLAAPCRRYWFTEPYREV